MTFSVLLVCTGNVCRSPVAERLLKAGLPDDASIHVSSAGTGALVGHGIDAPSALALRELGGSADGHVARRLDRQMIGAADLILTAETQHRDSIVRDEPLSFRRTFTMGEFARLGSGFGAVPEPTPEAFRARVVQIAALRGQVDPPERGADEIGDPFGAGVDVAKQRAAQINAAVDSILAALGVTKPARP